jgi:hypothetical protein
MNSARKLAPDAESDLAGRAPIDAPARADAGRPSSPPPIASWYTQGLSDGLGDRLLMFDNTAAASLELLRFRAELATAPGFERALRESVERLAFFKHPSFALARAVDYLDADGGLALVSTHTPGKRLSDLFQTRLPGGGMHPAFVTWLIRQLAPAIADFHGHGPGIAHGVLTAERIVLTPDGRAVIVEHVVGAALDQLRLSPTQMWRDLGVVAVPGFDGVPRLNGHADVVQLGLMALSVLLGRRMTPADYTDRVDTLLDEFEEHGGKRAPSLVAPLRVWLESALCLHGRRFASALDAARSVPELPAAILSPADPLVQTVGTTRPAAIASDRSAVATVARAATVVATNTNEPVVAVPEVTTKEIVQPPRASRGDELLPTAILDDPKPASALLKSEGSAEIVSSFRTSWQEHEDTGHATRLQVARTIAVVCAGIALFEAALLAYLLVRGKQPGSANAMTVPVTIESPTPGDVVMVNGQQVGVTPMTIDVGGSVHAIRVHSLERLQSPVADAKRPTPAPAPPVTNQANPPAATTVRSKPGGLRISSPIELQVLEGERVLGSSATGPIMATAGTHQLEFFNNALGYRSRQMVEIKAGEIVALTVRPPDGRVNVNAEPWAQVWIDGRLVGETPLANLVIPAGEHEVIFRHPQLGEKRQTALVKSGVPTRISAKLTRRSE